MRPGESEQKRADVLREMTRWPNDCEPVNTKSQTNSRSGAELCCAMSSNCERRFALLCFALRRAIRSDAIRSADLHRFSQLSDAVSFWALCSNPRFVDSKHCRRRAPEEESRLQVSDRTADKSTVEQSRAASALHSTSLHFASLQVRAAAEAAAASPKGAARKLHSLRGAKRLGAAIVYCIVVYCSVHYTPEEADISRPNCFPA